MTKYESVIFRLENWGKSCPWLNCTFCGESNKCTNPTIQDALDLLKSQEEGIAPKPTDEKTAQIAKQIGIFCPDYWCGNCKYQLIEHSKFCPNCGKKVKWDDKT